MSLLYSSSRKASDSYPLGDYHNYFILSDVNSNFLKKHNLNCSVKEFKDKVRKSNKFQYVRTGSSHYNYRTTRVYKITDFK